MMTDSQENLAATGIGKTDGHILVVDDDGQIRQLVAKFLRENGHRVTKARDGIEMRRALAGAAINLIVLDVILPGGNGFDLCRELRKTSNIPIIMLTARGTDTDRIVGLEIGADDYLAKPINPREPLGARQRRAAAGAQHRGHAIEGLGPSLKLRRLDA
jgi:two-component system OmpR family response regulator